jgi:hypothetical protein
MMVVRQTESVHDETAEKGRVEVTILIRKEKQVGQMGGKIIRVHEKSMEKSSWLTMHLEIF